MINECLKYFKSKPVLLRLLEELSVKYVSLNKIGGSVQLDNLSDDDIEVLEGLFSKNYHGKKVITISAKSLEKALKNTKYEAIDLKELILLFNNGQLLSKKEKKNIKLKREEEFFFELLEGYKDTFAYDYLHSIVKEKGIDYQFLIKKFTKNEEHTKKLIHNTLNAVNNMPSEFELLPVFAARITNDPHYFDLKNEGYTLLKKVLLFYLKEDLSYIPLREQREYILYKYKILIDSLSNSVLVYHVDGYINKSQHKGMEGFNQMKEPYHIPLNTINKLTDIKCHKSKIYVFENPSVFAEIIKRKEVSCLCISGYANISAYLLLDMAIKNNIQIIYAGDFDPEGLIISDILKRRYKERLEFLYMDLMSYKKSLSDVIINEKRIKSLDSIKSKELYDIINYMKKVRKAGYQEKLMDDYVNAI